MRVEGSLRPVVITAARLRHLFSLLATSARTALMLVPGPYASAAAPSAHDLMPAPEHLEWQPGHLLLGDRFAISGKGLLDTRVGAALPWVISRLQDRAGLRDLASRRSRNGEGGLLLEL